MKHELSVLMEGDGDAIINTSSIVGFTADGSEPYAASKHGMVGLTRFVAVWYAEEGARVNAACPGVVRTPMIGWSFEANPGAVEVITTEQPLGRITEPEGIASTVV